MTRSVAAAQCVAGFCAGCGGSGGSQSPHPGPPTPTPPEFRLTAQNALTALEVTLHPIDSAVHAADLLTNVIEWLHHFTSTGQYRYECPADLPGSVTWTHDDNDGNGWISPGDALGYDEDCGTGAVTVSLNVTAAQRNPPEQVLLRHLEYYSHVQGSVQFRFDQPEGPVAGSFDMGFSTAANAAWTLTDISVDSMESGVLSRLEATRFTKDLSEAARYYTVDTRGRLDSDTLNGAIEFSTSEPLVGRHHRFPTGGTLVLDAGNSRVQLTPSEDPALYREHIVYRLDPDGSGQFGTGTTARWDDLLFGRMFRLTENEAHTLSSPVIRPLEPDTTDRLQVHYRVSNPDEDDLRTTYEWFRNGTRLSGYGEDFLPPEETARGDIIEVHVAASDGLVTASLSTSTTIVDAPPTVTVPSPPPSVTYGQPVTFRATISDPDGDPLDGLSMVVDHGPSEMTVDSRTGIVSWRPDSPMFDRTMQVNWGLSVDRPGAGVGTGTTRIEKPNGGYPVMRAGIVVRRPGAQPQIGDFDGDGDQEMLVGSGILQEVDFEGGVYRTSWAHPYVSASAFATADVDGDARHEIFVGGETADDPYNPFSSFIIRLDGVDRRVVRKVSVPVDPADPRNSFTCRNMDVSDLDADGRPELICLATQDSTGQANRYLIVLSADDLTEVSRNELDFGGVHLSVDNVDDDAALEIIVPDGTYDGPDSQVKVFDGATLALEWSFRGGFARTVATGDLDGDGIDEIVAWDGSGVVAMSARTRSTLARLNAGSELPFAVVPDVSGDGRDDLAVKAPEHLQLYRYDPAAGAFALHRSHLARESFNETSPSFSMHVGDVDDDGRLDFITASSVGELRIHRLDDPLRRMWSSPDLRGQFVGGQPVQDAVNAPVLVFTRSRHNEAFGSHLLVAMDAQGDPTIVRKSTNPDRPAFWVPAPYVTDHDGDGADEVFYAVLTRSPDTVATVAHELRAAGMEWISPQLGDPVEIDSGDINGDGREEIVLLIESDVYAYDSYRNELIASWIEPSRFVNDTAMEVVDLDGDGRAEVVVTDAANGALITLDYDEQANTFVKMADYAPLRSISDIEAADVDGDGDVEVFVLNQSHVLRFDADLTFQSREYPWAHDISIEQTANRRKNLILTRYSQLVMIDAETGATVWESPNLIGGISSESVHVVQLPGEAGKRLSVGTSAAMYLTR